MPWQPEDWEAWPSRATDAPAMLDSTAQALHALLGRIPGSEAKVIADLRCGRGTRLPFLASRFRHVVALEASLERIEYARRQCRGMGIEFWWGGPRELTRSGRRFDVVLAVHARLGRAPRDLECTLSTIRGSLVEGGILIALLPTVPRRARGLRVRLLQDGEHQGRLLHEVELQYRLRAAGFQGLRIRRLRDESGSRESLLFTATRRANN